MDDRDKLMARRWLKEADKLDAAADAAGRLEVLMRPVDARMLAKDLRDAAALASRDDAEPQP